ncbi:hypothetical protein VI03_15070 [Burkholderia vietnamiensis]|nr:lipopolysaccharide biosynthesis protein [Burkholderia vietnamiensis]KKI38037.1 hypothetical protein VI03_15070 [Burkholderia vietnamiensis]
MRIGRQFLNVDANLDVDRAMSNINHALRKSLSTNFIGRYANIIVQIVVTGMLARVLSPAEFGVMAIVSVLVTFFSFVSEMGLGPAIVQFRDLDRSQIAGLFWVTVGIGAFAGAVFAACGPLIARLYDNAEYVHISFGLGLTIAFSCWTIVPLALLRRAQRFRAIVMIEVFSAVISGAIAIGGAYYGLGVFALVVKSATYAFLMFIFFIGVSELPYRYTSSIRGMRHVFAYSTYQFLFNVLNYFTRNLDKLLIGKVMGVTSLGLYDMSYRLMLMPVSNLTSVVGPAIQPVYAAYQQDRKMVFSSYQNLLRTLIVIGGLVQVVSVICAKEIILVFYGVKWPGAITIFYILSYSIGVQIVLSSTGAVYQALGRTDLLFKTGLISTLTTVGAILVGVVSRDLHVLSWLLVAGFFLNAIQGFWILARKGFGMRVIDLFMPSSKCVAGAMIVGLLCLSLDPYLNIAQLGVAMTLVVKILVISILYFIATVLTGDIAFVMNTWVRRRAV